MSMLAAFNWPVTLPPAITVTRPLLLQWLDGVARSEAKLTLPKARMVMSPTTPERLLMVMSPFALSVRLPPCIFTSLRIRSKPCCTASNAPGLSDWSASPGKSGERVWSTTRLPAPVMVTVRLLTLELRLRLSRAVRLRLLAVMVSPSAMPPVGALSTTLPLPTFMACTTTRSPAMALRLMVSPALVGKATTDRLSSASSARLPGSRCCNTST